MNFIEELKKGLHMGFINFQKASLEDYQPSLLMTISQTTIKNDKGEDKPIVNILFDMAHSVPDHLYDYLTQ